MGQGLIIRIDCADDNYLHPAQLHQLHWLAVHGFCSVIAMLIELQMTSNLIIVPATDANPTTQCPLSNDDQRGDEPAQGSFWRGPLAGIAR